METTQYHSTETITEQIELAGSPDPEVRRNLILQGAHSEILSYFKAFGTESEKNLAYLMELSPSEYEELADNPLTPPQVLEELLFLVGKENVYIRILIAWNPNVSKKIIDLLFKDENSDIVEYALEAVRRKEVEEYIKNGEYDIVEHCEDWVWEKYTSEYDDTDFLESNPSPVDYVMEYLEYWDDSVGDLEKQCIELGCVKKPLIF